MRGNRLTPEEESRLTPEEHRAAMVRLAQQNVDDWKDKYLRNLPEGVTLLAGSGVRVETQIIEGKVDDERTSDRPAV